MRAHARTPSQFIFMMYRASMTQRLAMLVSNQHERRLGRKDKIGAIDRRAMGVGGEENRKRERRGRERDERKHPRNVKRSNCLSVCGLLPLPFDLIAKERKIHDEQYARAARKIRLREIVSSMN